MYTDEHVDLLNRLGGLSVPLLARKYKLAIIDCKKILNCLVQDFENVFFKNREQIYIQDREPKFGDKKIKKETKNKIKPSRWKDITKP
jgi:hypothetical protein